MDTPLKSKARFRLGQIVYHSKFRYRGVIVDADPFFQGTEEWYDNVAKSKPDKNKPWYHVLVHGQGNALLTQAWVMEPKKKVQDVLKELSIADLKIKEFYRIKIGE